MLIDLEIRLRNAKIARESTEILKVFWGRPPQGEGV